LGFPLVFFKFLSLSLNRNPKVFPVEIGDHVCISRGAQAGKLAVTEDCLFLIFSCMLNAACWSDWLLLGFLYFLKVSGSHSRSGFPGK